MAAGPTYEPIATTTLGSAATSITFSSITSAYTDLMLVLTGKKDTATGSGISYRLNGDSGSNYAWTYISGDGASATSSSGPNFSFGYFGPALDATNLFLVTLDIFSYAGSTYKTALATLSDDNNGTGIVSRVVNLYRSTSAISSIELRCADSYAAGTTATLYGIKAA
jgi:hypothetical protein